MKRTQSGFTLVEIAIVLVIIGLLLGGVLKGQELVNSAKVKTLVNDFKTVPLFIYGYQDKFRALPGDDSAATTHLGSTALVADNTNKKLNNGRIDGAYNSETKTDESLVFWQHVRLANLATGPTNFSDASNITASVPRNSEGGRIGVQSDVPINGMTGSYFVCSDGIQGKFAKQIDITMDDGNTASGSVQVIGSTDATTGVVSAVTTTNIVDSETYTVCASF
jgi:prepilin-type N-terminal cleavage/methylation domain-containing protein